MPSLDINSKFAGYRAKTRPMYKVPKNVKEALCIDSVYEGGIFKLEPGSGTCLYDRCYLFEDIGYANLDKGKKPAKGAAPVRRDQKRNVADWVSRLMKKEGYDVAQADWITDCLQAGDTPEELMRFIRPNLSVEMM